MLRGSSRPSSSAPHVLDAAWQMRRQQTTTASSAPPSSAGEDADQITPARTPQILRRRTSNWQPSPKEESILRATYVLNPTAPKGLMTELAQSFGVAPEHVQRWFARELRRSRREGGSLAPAVTDPVTAPTATTALDAPLNPVPCAVSGSPDSSLEPSALNTHGHEAALSAQQQYMHLALLRLCAQRAAPEDDLHSTCTHVASHAAEAETVAAIEACIWEGDSPDVILEVEGALHTHAMAAGKPPKDVPFDRVLLSDLLDLADIPAEQDAGAPLAPSLLAS
eukprot:CAMPEP_0206042752 /NCGR_PEP_ID=MMETSP1466-20131121/6742_1 /ASSEMBLY_ACC=CAM_ASM_001126 /TAXON_ID=44452 /ORGANISM="Pavlova gyrans, Strain CCMP608" /LENGTH=280 /DNA_ID=CAMNT_0053417471 /DNA_START=72 /DNA_END=914 /DNA_ORIENTATION=+